jgi:hypothetical protein
MNASSQETGKPSCHLRKTDAIRAGDAFLDFCVVFSVPGDTADGANLGEGAPRHGLKRTG